MSLKHAILSFVMQDEKSGYDIVKSFDASVGYFWQASHQQVYKTLNTMEEAGWIVYRIETQNGKPDKKLYMITPQGKEELTRWACQPCQKKTFREEILVKLLMVDLVGTEVLIQEIKRLQVDCQQLLSTYRRIAAQHFSNPQLMAQAPLKSRSIYLTLRRGITSAEAKLTWLEEAEQLLTSSQ